jgi:transmembrane sensor
MEDEKEFEALVARLLANELSPQGEAAFFEQLELDPEKTQLFENYQSLWRLSVINDTPVIDTGLELSILKNKLEDYTAKVIPLSLPEEKPEPAINSEVKFFTLARLIPAISVAASILLIFVLAKNFSSDETKEKFKAPVVDEVVKSSNPFYRAVNESEKPKLILLSDGSEVLLYEKSEITYQKVFGVSRKIVLKGSARFHVARDKNKEFIVIGGGLQTKAIGTQFTVSAYENLKNTVVQLHEGKVVISAAEDFPKLKKDYFLIAGDELFFNKKTFQVKINKRIKETFKKSFPPNKDHPDFPKTKTRPWYMFNNQPLGEVLETLGSLYNVTVSYKKDDVKNRRFIGMFNQTDSLENILKQIAIVNDLKVKKNKNGFIIYK